MSERDGHRDTLFMFGILLIFFSLVGFLVVMYVSQERTIYAYDYGYYWKRAQSAVAKIHSALDLGSADQPVVASGGNAPADTQRNAEPSKPADRGSRPWTGLLSIVHSIWYEDYNDIPVLPLIPWLLVAGAGRLSWVLANLFIYVVPVAIVLSIGVQRLHSAWQTSRDRWLLVGPLLMLCLTPAFWAPLLRGFVDVGAVALNSLALILYLSKDSRQIGLRHCLMIGAIIALAVLFRRYNAFWLVSFVAVAAIDAVIGMVIARVETGEELAARAARPAAIALGAGLVLAVFAPPMLWRMATLDVGDLYSAFQFEQTWANRLRLARETLGDATLLWTAVAVAVGLLRRERRRAAAVVVAQLAIMFVHFNRKQTPAFHHFYLAMPGILLLGSLLMMDLIAVVRGFRARLAVVAATAAFAATMLWGTFAPGRAVFPEAAANLLPRPPYPPLVRSDLSAMATLYETIDRTLQQMGPAARFYILSATPSLSHSHFAGYTVQPPLSFRSSDRLLLTHAIDKVYGFPIRLLQADLVVVGTEPGGWGEASQVLLIPWSDFARGDGLANAFAMIGEIEGFEGGTRIRLFRRLRPNSAEEIAGLSNKLRELYPDRPYIYDPEFASTR